MSRIKIKASRHGENLFVDCGIYGAHGSVQITPALKPEDLKIEEDGRAYVYVDLLGRYGFIMEIRRTLITLF